MLNSLLLTSSMFLAKHFSHDLKAKQGETHVPSCHAASRTWITSKKALMDATLRPQARFVQPMLLPWSPVFTLRPAGPSSIDPWTYFHLFFRTLLLLTSCKGTSPNLLKLWPKLYWSYLFANVLYLGLILLAFFISISRFFGWPCVSQLILLCNQECC